MRLALKLHRAPPDELPQALAPGSHATGFSPRRLPTLEEAERERSLVLLVDDHPTNRQVIQRQLALAGYASETADDGVAGLARWRSGRYALVLSDVHMPHMDGYQLARAIREDEARSGAARTPMVALTASALKGEAERCLAAGMDDYLAKPVGIATLGTCLQRWLPHTAERPPRVDADSVADGPPAIAAAPALPQLAHPPTPLDPAVLADLTAGDVAEARALLQDFLASTDEDLVQLQALRGGGDLPGLTRQAHKIKGAARLVGAVELAEAATRLEAAGRGGDWAGVLPLAADVATAIERLRLDVAGRYPA
jgi:CheY-like chemotaxis protein/HPt (histidine-containing phosphotransfer) domain-containing protein